MSTSSRPPSPPANSRGPFRFVTASLERKIILVILVTTLVPALVFTLFVHFSQRRALYESHGSFLRESLERYARESSEDLRSLIAQTKRGFALRRPAPPFFRAATPETPEAPPVFFPKSPSHIFWAVASPEGDILWSEALSLKQDLEEIVRRAAVEHAENANDTEFTEHYGLLRSRSPFLGDKAEIVSGEQTVSPEEKLLPVICFPLSYQEGSSDTAAWGVLVLHPATFLENVSPGRFEDIALYTSGGRVTAWKVRESESRKMLSPAIIQRLKEQSAGWEVLEPKDHPELDTPYFIAYGDVSALNPMSPSPEAPGWYLVGLANADPVASSVALILWTTMLLGAMMLGAVTLWGWTLSKRILHPLRLLRNDVRALAEGHLEARVELATKDELSLLGADINTMAETLETTYFELQNTAEAAERRADYLALLNRLSHAMTASLNLQETVDSVGEFLSRLAGIDYAALATREFVTTQSVDTRPPFLIPGVTDSSQGVPSPTRGVNKEAEAAHKSTGSGEEKPEFEIRGIRPLLSLAQPYAEDEIRGALLSEEPFIIGAEVASSRTKGEFLSAVILPLRTETDEFGALILASKEKNAFFEARLGNLKSVAEALTAAIQHVHLLEEVRGLAASLERKVKHRTAELVRTQSKLVQTEKFAATGKLAANLAHEINNPLGIIKNNLRLMKGQIDKGKIDAAQKTIDVCGEEIGRIARLTNSMLNFYRVEKTEARDIDMRAEIDNLLVLVQKTFERKKILIEINQPLNADTKTLLPPDLVRQVFWNIIRNAEDAMEEKSDGKLTIDISNCPLPDASRLNEEETSEMTPYPVEWAIRVSLSDNGGGIPKEIIEEIFDPFFTTKPEEKGTGLGLPVCLGIMNRLGGTIEVESTPGEGTRFDLYFPIIAPLGTPSPDITPNPDR